MKRPSHIATLFALNLLIFGGALAKGAVHGELDGFGLAGLLYTVVAYFLYRRCISRRSVQ